MILETFPVGPLASNCTILGDEETHEAIVIDPGAEAGRILRRLKELGLDLKQILLTHAHLDHVGGVLPLKEQTGALIFLNGNDLPQLDRVATQAAWMGIVPPEVALPDEDLTDGQIVGLARYPAKVLFTPGHTQGSVCFYLAEQKLLIAGDTLFAGSIGRTDLPGGDSGMILQSLQLLMQLPDETKVLPGHGPTTTIGEERRGNPYLRG